MGIEKQDFDGSPEKAMRWLTRDMRFAKVKY
jgi:hypothetical protein